MEPHVPLPREWQTHRPQGTAAIVELAQDKVRFYVQLGCEAEVHANARLRRDTLLLDIYGDTQGERPLASACFCGPCNDVLFSGTTPVHRRHLRLQAIFDDTVMALVASDLGS